MNEQNKLEKYKKEREWKAGMGKGISRPCHIPATPWCKRLKRPAPAKAHARKELNHGVREQ